MLSCLAHLWLSFPAPAFLLLDSLRVALQNNTFLYWAFICCLKHTILALSALFKPAPFWLAVPLKLKSEKQVDVVAVKPEIYSWSLFKLRDHNIYGENLNCHYSYVCLYLYKKMFSIKPFISE